MVNIPLSHIVGQYTPLPDIEQFHSILTKKSITPEEYQTCQDAWTHEGMRTFEDYVRYYNDAGVIGFAEAIEKIITNERTNNLDIFKESISLPGLTQRYLIKKLDKDDYFVGFGQEHKHLYKLLKDNIVGGPSIMFHRYHEKNVTRIKGKDFTKTVIRYDANSLYLYCQQVSVPFSKKRIILSEVRYSREAIQWLE